MFLVPLQSGVRCPVSSERSRRLLKLNLRVFPPRYSVLQAAGGGMPHGRGVARGLRQRLRAAADRRGAHSQPPGPGACPPPRARPRPAGWDPSDMLEVEKLDKYRVIQLC